MIDFATESGNSGAWIATFKDAVLGRIARFRLNPRAH